MIFNPPTLTIDSVGKLSNVPESLVADVMQAFTMANPKYAEAQKRSAFAALNVPKQLKHFALEKDYISFPRGATRIVINLCINRGIKLVLKDNRVSRPLERKITFTGTLREYQQESSDAALANDFGVVEAGTGAGKTVIACNVIAQKSVYTVICVPSKELMYQWQKRLCSFTDLKESEIGLVGDGIYDVKPITVAIINTLAKHSDELKEYFEYLVVDEAHRVAAEMYVGGPLTSLATKSMTGLSATLMRGDGLIDLLFWYIGRVLHKVDSGKLREINAIMEPFVWQKKTNFFSKNAEKSYTKMISEMVADSNRNYLITKEVIADARWRAGQGGGLVLVVSDRVSHLKELYKTIAGQLGESRVALLTGQISS
jgi:superfamily II DNA or RNA helicase